MVVLMLKAHGKVLGLAEMMAEMIQRAEVMWMDVLMRMALLKLKAVQLMRVDLIRMAELKMMDVLRMMAELKWMAENKRIIISVSLCPVNCWYYARKEIAYLI